MQAAVPSLVDSGQALRLSSSGVLVLTGHRIAVTVERGQLLVSDGFAGAKRSGRFHRATSRPRRLVIIGGSGYVSLEAMRWLHRVGAATVHLDPLGEVISVTAPAALDDARLRRAQALAAANGRGIEIARELVRRKLDGQAQLLLSAVGAAGAARAVQVAADAVDDARDSRELMLVEAAAAQAYWGAWADIPVRFARRDASHVPQHWLSFGGRASPLTNSPRKAVNPANALANYLYAVLEAEGRIAALTLGLDPGMGVLHADQRGRDSLALDLMEAARVEVDRYVLHLLSTRTFAAREFFETNQGDCRLVAPLPEQLTGFHEAARAAIGPVAEWVAQQLSTGAPVAASPPRVSTPLTQRNRSAGRDAVRRAASVVRPARLSAGAACERCGIAVAEDRKFCSECLPGFREEQARHLRTAGPAALARLRAASEDPTTTAAAKAKLRERRLANLAANRAWDAENPDGADPTQFREAILPALQATSLRALSRASGLSIRHCWSIRRGEAVPHPRHWEAFRKACATN